MLNKFVRSAARGIALAAGISAAQAGAQGLPLLPAAPAGASPVLISANLICIDVNGCETQHLSILTGAGVPFGFRFGLATDGNSTIDIGGEFFAAASAAVAAGAPVPCGGTHELAFFLDRGVIVNRHLLRCQLVYICVKDGRITAGKEADDLIDVHNDPYDKNKLPVHCA